MDEAKSKSSSFSRRLEKKEFRSAESAVDRCSEEHLDAFVFPLLSLTFTDEVIRLTISDG